MSLDRSKGVVESVRCFKGFFKWDLFQEIELFYFPYISLWSIGGENKTTDSTALI